MSRNKKYIDKFDKAAGKPADFDSLFCFDGEDIVAKKQIRVRIMRKRAMIISSAAAAVFIAVMGICIGYISTAGLAASDRGETGLTSAENVSAAFDETVYQSSGINLSDLLDTRFDYFMSDNDYPKYDSSGERAVSERNSIEAANVYIRVKVVSKSYVSPNTSTIGSDTVSWTNIYYDLYPYEYFTFAGNEYNYTILDKSETFTVARDFADNHNELQPGEEYFIPFTLHNSTENTSLTGGMEWLEFADDQEMPIIKTDSGWIVSDMYPFDLSAGQPVNSDLWNYKTEGSMYLMSNDDLLSSIYAYFAENGGGIHNSRDSISVTSYSYETVFKNAEFENVQIDSDGKTLILYHENYFDLVPNIWGNVVFAGASRNGGNTVVINASAPDSSAPIQTVIFTGLDRLYVKNGDYLTNGVLVGSCSEPVYCICVDEKGNKVPFSEERITVMEAAEIVVEEAEITAAGIEMYSY